MWRSELLISSLYRGPAEDRLQAAVELIILGFDPDFIINQAQTFYDEAEELQEQVKEEEKKAQEGLHGLRQGAQRGGQRQLRHVDRALGRRARRGGARRGKLRDGRLGTLERRQLL